MPTSNLFEPKSLTRYSFLWSQVRQVVAAVALFVGGVPVVYYFSFLSFLAPFLTLMWLISGAAAVYLVYRWGKNDWRVFGGKQPKDVAAFFISCATGINLGLVGLLRMNIGMSIASGRIIFIITGVVYLWTAWHLHKRWMANDRRLFTSA